VSEENLPVILLQKFEICRSQSEFGKPGNLKVSVDPKAGTPNPGSEKHSIETLFHGNLPEAICFFGTNNFVGQFAEVMLYVYLNAIFERISTHLGFRFASMVTIKLSDLSDQFQKLIVG